MIGRVIVLTSLLLALGASSALAHVEVLPPRATAGEPTTFTIRVPQEEGVISGVRVTFPDSISVYGIRPPAGGFTAEAIERGGALRGVDYSGGAIGSRQYQDFQVLGTPQEIGHAVWRVEERLADGSIRLWTGPPESIDAPRVEPDDNGTGPAASVEVVAAGDTAVEEPSDDSSALWLAMIAAVLALAALVVAGMVWTSRPVELPSDD